MGLCISRIIIAMENQQSTQPYEDEGTVFHKSKFARVSLAIGLVFQTTIGCFTLVWLIFQNYGYSSTFSFEVFRMLTLIYGIGYLWSSTIWFLCIYYNKSLPRDKLFILFELARSIPWLLTTIVFFVVGIPDILRELRYALDGGYYGGYLLEFIVKCVVCTVVILPALWSLVWMFVYFIRERKEEIVKALGIGKKRGEDDAKAAKDAGGTDGEATTGRTGNDQDAEETPLLIDHDQMV
ncbi:hypothetical protein TWF506_011387 [Arthrobotrys conoides]|uniref:Uncharacterized protein n=1 Tax=Arthrobotrys conoides TaxID=74498 RepID=A0AAN8NEG0_9PEZI